MTTASVIPFVPDLITKRLPFNVTAATTGFIRQIAMRPYIPSVRKHEFRLQERLKNHLSVRNKIYKEKGEGDIPTIVVGGFVPDATEAIEFQRPLLRRYGSIYYVNFARNGFSLEMFHAQLMDLIEDINRRGRRPVIFSISFGCGLVADFLKKMPESRGKIRGVVMTSPVLCTDDLVRPERGKNGGVRMIESNLKRILKTDAENSDEVKRQIDRARKCFSALFEAGAENRELSSRHLSIKRKVMDSIEKTPARGGYERVLALRDFTFQSETPIFAGPSLMLLAEAEDDLLVPNSPTLSSLRNADTRKSLFPRCSFKNVASPTSGDMVAHASLIFHQHCYNPLIESWYNKLLSPVLFAVV